MSSKQVLLVSLECDTRDEILKLLSQNSINCVVAESPADAIRLVEAGVPTIVPTPEHVHCINGMTVCEERTINLINAAQEYELTKSISMNDFKPKRRRGKRKNWNSKN